MSVIYIQDTTSSPLGTSPFEAPLKNAHALVLSITLGIISLIFGPFLICLKASMIAKLFGTVTWTGFKESLKRARFLANHTLHTTIRGKDFICFASGCDNQTFKHWSTKSLCQTAIQPIRLLLRLSPAKNQIIKMLSLYQLLLSQRSTYRKSLGFFLLSGGIMHL